MLKFINKIKIEKYILLDNKIEIKSRALSREEILIITELMKSKSVIDFSEIRTKLNLNVNERFNLISYASIFELNEAINKNSEKKKRIKEFENYHKIKRVINKQGNLIETLSTDDLDNIAYILTVYKSEDKRLKELSKKNIILPQEVLEELLQISFREISDISIKALKQIIPYLENGTNYKLAIKELYLQKRLSSKMSRVNLNTEILSPIARRTISQTIKILNAIINKYGTPNEVIFRTSKQLTQKRSIRDKNKKFNTQRKIYNSRIKEELLALGVRNPTTTDFIKYELWKQQNGICMYSGEIILVKTLFTDLVSIDYIIPYNISFDESLDNKVIVMTGEKQEKSNRTAYQYIVDENKDLERYKTRINNLKTWKKKRNLLQNSTYINIYNFEDLHYMNMYLQNYIHSKFGNIKTTSVNNSILHYIKHQLNISNVPSEGLKSSLNAIITALISNKDELNGISKLIIKQQCKNFAIHEINIELLFKHQKINGQKALINSHMPTRKVSGKAHDETIRSKQVVEKIIKGYTKTELKKLKLDKMGEIDGYPKELINNDLSLYNALKSKLLLHNGNAAKAFEEKFYKPNADGSNGALVKKVKLEQKMTLPTELRNNAIATNGYMIRIDIFKVEGEGFYFIPIYVSDTVKEQLPNKACVSKKTINDWKEMREEDFIFSIYPNDLIYMESYNEIKLHSKSNDNITQSSQLLVYFVSADISSASISVINTDNTYTAKGIGIKNLKQLKKYDIDILGNYHEIKKKEVRKQFIRTGKTKIDENAIYGYNKDLEFENMKLF